MIAVAWAIQVISWKEGISPARSGPAYSVDQNQGLIFVSVCEKMQFALLHDMHDRTHSI